MKHIYYSLNQSKTNEANEKIYNENNKVYYDSRWCYRKICFQYRDYKACKEGKNCKFIHAVDNKEV